MLTERSKVPSEAKKRYFFPVKNPLDARREVVLALWQQFSVDGEVLKWFKVFKYLGCLLAQDNDDI